MLGIFRKINKLILNTKIVFFSDLHPCHRHCRAIEVSKVSAHVNIDILKGRQDFLSQRVMDICSKKKEFFLRQFRSVEKKVNTFQSLYDLCQLACPARAAEESSKLG